MSNEGGEGVFSTEIKQQVSTISLNDLRNQVQTVTSDIDSPLYAEKKELEPVADALRDKALDFLNNNKSADWLIQDIERQRNIDGIIAEMRHAEQGVSYTLRELQKIKPDITWYRGGTLKKWRDHITPMEVPTYSEEDLETYVIDGGRNGILGIPTTALVFLTRLAKREEPAFYSIPLDGLIDGWEQNDIYLTSEHFYDLVIANGKEGWKGYLDFCRKHLKVQKVLLNEVNSAGD